MPKVGGFIRGGLEDRARGGGGGGGINIEGCRGRSGTDSVCWSCSGKSSSSSIATVGGETSRRTGGEGTGVRGAGESGGFLGLSDVSMIDCCEGLAASRALLFRERNEWRAMAATTALPEAAIQPIRQSRSNE